LKLFNRIFDSTCSPRLKETVLRIVLRYFREFQRENIRL
jgi:hypothetical protein